MRAHSLGRWVGRVMVVAAFGVGATLGATASASADEASPDAATSTASDTASEPGASTDSYEWH